MTNHHQQVVNHIVRFSISIKEKKNEKYHRATEYTEITLSNQFRQKHIHSVVPYIINTSTAIINVQVVKLILTA